MLGTIWGQGLRGGKMKRLATWTLGLALMAGVARAQLFSGPPDKTVGDVAVTVDLVSVSSMSIKNTGTNPIWGQAYYRGQAATAITATACTAIGVPANCSPLKLDPGEEMHVGIDSNDVYRIRYVVLICGAGLSSKAKITGVP